eukprot:6230027-Alexandrium_andersonii.AAC.1
MSASLVGSEMCIRDSARPEQSNPLLLHPPMPAARVCDSEAPKSRTNSSVSYTHLTLPTICSV